MHHYMRQHSIGFTRRGVLYAAGAVAGAALDRHAWAADGEDLEARVLARGDTFGLEVDPREIVEKAYQLGHEYEGKHGGCARCTVAALQDALPMVASDEGLFRAATCLDGGATPVGEQNCGGFTGAGMVIGYVCGSRRNDTFHGTAELAHGLLHQVYRRFAEAYGTVLCCDVRKGAKGDCPEVVGQAARWTAEAILGAFCGYVPREESKEKPPADTESDSPA